MKINKDILFNLNEKASIDWNNYLTGKEVDIFLQKDDKVESAENIIYNEDFKDRFQDFKKSGWTRRELVQDLSEFYYNGHLNEGIHLYGFVTDEDGNHKVIEDRDYPDKKSFKNDLMSNGYRVRRVNDNKDMYIMDNSDYMSVNQVVNRIKFILKNSDGKLLSFEQQEVDYLNDLLDKANKVSLNEGDLGLWKRQMKDKDTTQLVNKLKELYSKLADFNDNNTDIRTTSYFDLIDKISYLESRLGIQSKIGREIH